MANVVQDRFLFAKNLTGISVISVRGIILGKLDNFEIDEKTGEILSIIMEPQKRAETDKFPKTKDGKVKIPYTAVIALRDVVVVDPSRI
jgi:sporulation protein YlmC with PRC-barrel domain